MKRSFAPFVFFSTYLILSSSLLSQDTIRSRGGITPGTIKQIKSVRQFQFEVGKTIGYIVDPEEIGYRSVSGIVICGESAFICDQGFNQVTKIDLNTGRILAIKKLQASPWDVICFNGYVYVTANDHERRAKVLLVFDAHLQSVLEKVIGVHTADDWNFDTANDDFLMISYKIFEPLSCDSICLVKVDRRNRVSIDTVSEAEFCDIMSNIRSVVPPRLLQSSFCEKEVEVRDFVVRGKRFMIEKGKDRDYLVTDYGWFQMPDGSTLTSCPGLKIWKPATNVYTASNFDFTRDKAVFFDVDSRKFTLCICRY